MLILFICLLKYWDIYVDVGNILMYTCALCSVMGQLTEDNNMYCKTKVILTKHFTCSCWWWSSLAKTCQM